MRRCSDGWQVYNTSWGLQPYTPRNPGSRRGAEQAGSQHPRAQQRPPGQGGRGMPRSSANEP
eukprot:15471429-Alexandrium_andersonii.AAC.1